MAWFEVRIIFFVPLLLLSQKKNTIHEQQNIYLIPNVDPVGIKKKTPDHRSVTFVNLITVVHYLMAKNVVLSFFPFISYANKSAEHSEKVDRVKFTLYPIS